MKTVTVTEHQARVLVRIIETSGAPCADLKTVHSILEALRAPASSLTDDDYDNLGIINYFGRLHCSGNRGRMTLAAARRLERKGFVAIKQPPINEHRGARPNRSWEATITEEGKAALEDWRAKQRDSRP